MTERWNDCSLFWHAKDRLELEERQEWFVIGFEKGLAERDCAGVMTAEFCLSKTLTTVDWRFCCLYVRSQFRGKTFDPSNRMHSPTMCTWC